MPPHAKRKTGGIANAPPRELGDRNLRARNGPPRKNAPPRLRGVVQYVGHVHSKLGLNSGSDIARHE